MASGSCKTIPYMAIPEFLQDEPIIGRKLHMPDVTHVLTFAG
jgi:hypothetical protein